VNSLYTYARLADVLIIIAPTSQHTGFDEVANLSTYKKRVWTRAEQVSFFCNRGTEQMFIMQWEFEKVPDGWMDDVAALFEGNMTCCSRKHPGGGACDRESLVSPMLGMYFDVMSRKALADNRATRGGLEDQKMGNLDIDQTLVSVAKLIQEQKHRMFPVKYSYVTQSDKVTQHTLFGHKIARIDSMFAHRTKRQTILNSHNETQNEARQQAAHASVNVEVPSASAKQLYIDTSI